MGGTACTEPQCLYKGDLYLFLIFLQFNFCRGELCWVLQITEVTNLAATWASRFSDSFFVDCRMCRRRNLFCCLFREYFLLNDILRPNTVASLKGRIIHATAGYILAFSPKIWSLG